VNHTFLRWSNEAGWDGRSILYQ